MKNCKKRHGSWAFAVDVGVSPDTGKRKQRSRSGFRTQAAAEDALTRELAALEAGAWTDDRNVTVAEWLDQWLSEIAGRIGPKTLHSYRQHAEDHLKPHLGRIRLRDLRRGHVEAMFAVLARPRPPEARPTGNSGRFVRQRSTRTLDGYRRTLRAALNAAMRRGLISMNVAEGRIDALPRSRPPELHWWEPEETARFLEAVADDDLGALFEVAAYTGLRRSELLGLRWADVDEHGITVRQTLVSLQGVHSCTVCRASHKGRYLKSSAKSDSGLRWVPLVKPAAEALRAHHKAQDEHRQAFGADYADHDLVFCRPDGNPLRPDAVTRRFETLTDAVRFPDDETQPDGTPTPDDQRRRLTRIRLHDLRHGAASLLLAGGVPIELVAMILGHSSPAVTRRIYAHVLRDQTHQLVATASEMLTKHRRID